MEQAVVGLSDSKDGKQVVGTKAAEENSPQKSLQDSASQKTAKGYSRAKITISVVRTVLYFSLTVCVLVFGVSTALERVCRAIASNDYLVLLLFVASFGVIEMALSFPLSLYSGYVLEHKYYLSNQNFIQWLWEGIKGLLVSIPITTPILLALYYCLRTFGQLWWLPVGSLLFLFSVVMARLAPIFIFPLFYKFKPVEEVGLKKRILNLCEKVGVRVEGIFVFDLSKNTKKANAAFTGIGKSRRIILGDTLVANFTDEEIETVFAHELGHYKLKHIWVTLAVGTVSSFFGLFCTAQLYTVSSGWFGFTGVEQIAALPLLALWLGLYSLVTSPVGNMISRAHERSADRYAIETTKNARAFSNAMRKLAAMNLSDTAPHPLVEFLFYSHPSIEKRIQAAEKLHPV